MPEKPLKNSGRTARAAAITKRLAKTYPDAECALSHESPYELLVATILSAQCTDERVNAVTPILFARYPSPAELAVGKQADVEKIIHSLGFFRAKATSLLGMARKVVDEFGGEIPQTLDELVSLPGVGRKTANVVMGTAFGEPTGVVVDTHVARISKLLGLTKNGQPEKIEQALMALLPQKEWINSRSAHLYRAPAEVSRMPVAARLSPHRPSATRWDGGQSREAH
jgi:endonuclease III